MAETNVDIQNNNNESEPKKSKMQLFEELISNVWNKPQTLSLDEAQVFMADKTRLAVEGITYVKDDKAKTVLFTREPALIEDMHTRKYYMPDFAEEVSCLIQQSLSGNGMVNLMLTGMAGTGKTEFVYEMAKKFGVKVFQVNGSEGLTGADFYGTMAVAVDEKTKQNYTYFDKGPLYLAFIEGTKVDENGNQILDENGEPIVVGPPAFFFLDEFAAMLPEVFLGVFNRAMEVPRTHGKGRSIEIPLDNGRIVKSHPSLVMFLSGNTVGTGNNGRYQMGYTAQGNKMDESTRNRITGFYQFGYNKVAEKEIALSILNDDYEVARLMSFRDNMRNMFKDNKAETLFTTRSIVATCEVAKSFREAGIKDWMANALKVAVFNGLPETDKPGYNQMINQIWNYNILTKNGKNSDYDYI